MVEFVSGVYHLLSGVMTLGLLGIGILIGLTILGLLAARSRKAGKRHGSKHGFFHFYDSTLFDVSSSVKCRFAGGHLASDPADDESHPANPCANDKPFAVIKFTGDVAATGRQGIARLIDEVIVNKAKLAGCVVVVGSPGGGVAEYGQLYAEMERLRNADIYLVVCVDTYAASGGYLMSLPANKIVAAPFASLGSIGVVAEFLNFHDFLVALGVTPLTLTAGDKKRSITQFGAVTDEGKQHFLAQLTAIHDQFKAVVSKYRKDVDVEKVCNGDHWTAQQAYDEKLGLVDEINTSQGFLLKLNLEHNLVYLSERYNPLEKSLLRLLTVSIDHLWTRISSTTNGGIR